MIVVSTEREREEISSLNKMITYRQIKSDFSIEKYLSLPSHLRSALAKFRDQVAILSWLLKQDAI